MNIVGLTELEVKDRISRGLVNGDQNVKTKSVGQILFTNCFTFYNALFAGIAVILAIFNGRQPGEPVTLSSFADFGFVLTVLINLAIGIVQEIKAKRTIDKLSLLSAPKVTVIRDGQEKEIALKDIVMDDVVCLSAGRQICADSVVLDGFIEVNESLITGEPDAIPKSSGEELLSGSFVVSGTAKVKVIRIGKDNYATKISAGAKYIKEYPSEIRKSLTKFIRIMGIAIIPIGIALFCVKYLLQNNELNSTVQTVMGNLIGMIPSGLVTLTSAIFCVSVIKMARHRALAQDLYAVETLARVDVLCLDKTGTLTEGSMQVEEIIPCSDENVASVLKGIVDLTCDNNLTAEAIREFVSAETYGENVVRSIPFSAKHKFSGIITENCAYVFGAPEFVLKDELDGDKKEIITSKTEKGLRVLALVKCEPFQNTDLPEKTDLLAFIVISDKIRKEAPDTLKFFAEQGVAIKIISGDNPITVSKIAERAGVLNYDKYVDVSELNTEEDMLKALEEITVFGRTTPDKKLTLIKLLKQQGHTVAMTGDGVNDVLALREADCSVAMASGSDAAKNVSQLVLLDSNFACLPKAVAEGRRTINNLERSASLFLVKTLYNLLFAVAFLIISSDLPFAPRQMTFISMFTIGIPSMYLALEPNEELVTGNFFKKVIGNALPTSLTVVICVVSATLSARFYPEQISGQQLSTICTIIVGFIGFMYIAKISYPYNAGRLVLLLGLIGVFVLGFFLRLDFFSAPEFYGLCTDFNNEMLLILCPIGGLSIPLFIGMSALVNLLNKKLSDKQINIFRKFGRKGDK